MFRRAIAENIEIRQFEPADAEVVFAAVERNRAYLRQWLPWVDLTASAADTRAFIERAVAQFEEGRGPSTGIWVDEVFAGSIGFHPFELADRSCSLGYWIQAGYQGRGTITRCCLSMLDYAFHQAGMHRAEIRCGTANLRSSAIPQRLGFTREGVLREAQWVNGRWIDLEVWSMLEPDWRKRV